MSHSRLLFQVYHYYQYNNGIVSNIGKYLKYIMLYPMTKNHQYMHLEVYAYQITLGIIYLFVEKMVQHAVILKAGNKHETS